MTAITAYPLTWPTHLPRYSRPRDAGPFKTSLAGALDNVDRSLRGFAKDSGKALSAVVISSNVTLGAYRPEDPGVAVWFTWDGLQVCIPVDRYKTTEANLQAIHHIIEARRTELRHGTLALVRASFMGFKALPAPPGSDWRSVLEIPPGGAVTRIQVEGQFKALASKYHPDKPTGSTEKMQALNKAREQGLAELG